MVVKSRYTNRKLNTERRNEDVKKRYNELYDIKRLRMDDCINQVAWEFYLQPSQIWTILRMPNKVDKDGFNEEDVHKDQGELF